MRAIVLKDLKLFFRDTSQWSQLFLLFSLMIVYIYSFKLLPLDRAAMPSFYLQNLIAFLNLGMVGFVTSAVAVRFVFPAVSLEGASFWIIRSAPLSISTFLWAKFWSSLLPLLVLAEALIILSNTLLKVTPFMMELGIVTVFTMTFGITSLGVGLGAVFPRFKHENVAQIPDGLRRHCIHAHNHALYRCCDHHRGLAYIPNICGPNVRRTHILIRMASDSGFIHPRLGHQYSGHVFTK
jgi:ABC-2 type transport system permease protein